MTPSFREILEVLNKHQVEYIVVGGHLLLMTRAGPLDVLGFIGDNQRYEDVVGASMEIQMAAGPLKLLNIEELIAQKRRMDRAKDHAAADLLEEVLRYR